MNPAEKLRVLHDKLKRGERLSKAEQRFVDKAERPAEYYPTLEAAAEHYGVVRSALDRWKEGYPEGFVKTAQGYEAKGIAEARRRFLASGKLVRLNEGDVAKANDGEKPAESADYESLEALKARKLRLECDKLATQIDILQGKYALVADVMTSLMPIVYAIKERFLKLGPEISFQLSGMEPADIEDKIRAEVERILNKLADEDIPRLGETLGQPKEIGEEENRLPAARNTNGRQKSA